MANRFECLYRGTAQEAMQELLLADERTLTIIDLTSALINALRRIEHLEQEAVVRATTPTT